MGPVVSKAIGFIDASFGDCDIFMKVNWLFFGLFVVFANVAAKAAPHATCIGNPKSTLGVIYLHDADTDTGTIQERGHRVQWEKLVQVTGIRLALPRGNRACADPKDHTCWKQLDKSQVSESKLFIDESTKSCLSQQKKVIAIGFGNGGGVTNRLLQFCVPHTFKQLVTIGQSSELRDDDPADLSACGNLTLLVGSLDVARTTAAKKYVEALKLKHAHARLQEYDGEHIFPFLLVLKILKDNLE